MIACRVWKTRPAAISPLLYRIGCPEEARGTPCQSCEQRRHSRQLPDGFDPLCRQAIATFAADGTTAKKKP